VYNSLHRRCQICSNAAMAFKGFIGFCIMMLHCIAFIHMHPWILSALAGPVGGAILYIRPSNGCTSRALHEDAP
jgi:hypothetical protein